MAALDGQSCDFHHLRLVLDMYQAVRQNGGSVDIVGPEADLSGYQLVILPAVLAVSGALATQLENTTAQILIGPRPGAKTTDFQIPANLPPGPVQGLAGFCVEQADALPADQPVACRWGNVGPSASGMKGAVTGTAEGQTEDAHPLMIHNQGLAILPAADQKLFAPFSEQMKKAGLVVHDLPACPWVRQRGDMLVFTNYGCPARIPQSFTGGLLLGDRLVPPAGVAVLSVSG